MISITDHITLDPEELEFSFVRASGPGGQNVNKVSSAVQLRFNAAESPSLPPDVRSRVISLAGRRANRQGIIVIEAKRFRHQTRNREDALNRLVALIVKATQVGRPRRPGKPPKSSRTKRLNEKKRRGSVKQLRKGPGTMD
ncbi:MAG: alternative ribosome rescue aminoacyl-tRNA hydrolase ArfB [Rhodospirillaceae bacterium]|nr:alternative ribosome rescue aminoacyl-tRNA hydrolase ArfB [Rhodospirillaceae bacterium]